MIHLDRVYYTYGNQQDPAVKDMTFHVDAGERLAIFGRSGSGKTTLGRILAGLLQPTAGNIIRGGTVSIVFENPETQFVADVVEADVAFGPENLGLATVEIRERVDEALYLVGASHLRNRRISTLSGGEKQRIALAGALAMQPSCLVLDEFSAMLHPLARDELEQSIDHIRRERSLTFVHTTHDGEEAARADRVILIHDGQCKKVGPPEEILRDFELLRTCGVRPPDALFMADVMKQHGIAVSGYPFTIEDLAGKIDEVFRSELARS